MKRLSVVVIARDEGAELRRTIENLRDTLPGGAEIVALDDGSRDGCARFLGNAAAGVRVVRTGGLGVARARNLGAGQARGDWLVFADAHIRVSPGWWRPLEALVENPRVAAAAPGVEGMRRGQPAGFGLTFRGPDLNIRWHDMLNPRPFPALILPGCCLAVRRDVFDEVGGWDAGLYGVGGNDNEFCLRLWLLGYRLMVAPGVVIQHRFRKRSRVPVDGPQHLHNLLRTAVVHFKPKRVGRVFAAHQHDRDLGPAVALLTAGDAAARRRELWTRRIRNDDWCFERFSLEW
jgi:GT2 family glycosyltransferase